MHLLKLSLRNAARSRARSVMTVVAVAISLLAFAVLRAVSAGWTQQVEQTPDDRVLVHHRMGWGRSLPVNYVQDVAGIPGVLHVIGVTWADLHSVQTTTELDGYVSSVTARLTSPDAFAAFASALQEGNREEGLDRRAREPVL